MEWDLTVLFFFFYTCSVFLHHLICFSIFRMLGITFGLAIWVEVFLGSQIWEMTVFGIIFELGIKGWHKLRIFRLFYDGTRRVKAAFVGNDALKVWWMKGNAVKGFLHAKPLKIINQRGNMGMNLSQVHLISIFWWVKRKYFQSGGHPKLAGNTI